MATSVRNACILFLSFKAEMVQGGKILPHEYNNKTVLLRDTVHQTSRGESAAVGLTAGQPRPLTPRGMSRGPYHVTTQFYFYPVISQIQNLINIYPWFWCRLMCPIQDYGNS